MKKQLITKDDIRRDLLAKINKAKKLSIFLTIITAVSIPAYTWCIINYDDIMFEYTYHHLAGRGLHPAFGLLVTPIVILFLTVFLLDFYYVDLFRTMTGRFLILEEKVYQQKREHISYYRRFEKENALYFRCGRVSVEDQVYSQSNVGDTFYVIVLRTQKAPKLVYNTKYYEIVEQV